MLKNIKTKNKSKGNFGESIACKYLEKNGYEIICRNFSCMQGEIDIIFKDKSETVFGEVKSRTGIDYGFPAESVNYFKQKHILCAAKYYLYVQNLTDIKIRFDVIEVYIGKNKPIINHIKDAF